MMFATTAIGGILIVGLEPVDLEEVWVANMLPALPFGRLLVAAVPRGRSSFDRGEGSW